MFVHVGREMYIHLVYVLYICIYIHIYICITYMYYIYVYISICVRVPVPMIRCLLMYAVLQAPLGEYSGPGAATVREEIYNKLHTIVSSFSPFIQLVEHSIDLEEAKKGVYIISQRFDPRMGEALKKRHMLLRKLQEERAAAEETLDLPRRRDGDAVKLVDDPTLGFALRVVKRDQQAVLVRFPA